MKTRNSAKVISRIADMSLVKDNINTPFARGPIGQIVKAGVVVKSGQWRYIRSIWASYVAGEIQALVVQACGR